VLQRIEHPQDADRDYDFAVTDAQGNGENVTGWTFAFTVWNDVAEIPAKLFELTSAAGGIAVDVLNPGVGRILVRASALAAFDAGRYRAKLTCVRSPGASPDVLADSVFILLPKSPTT
jgi:hypothetical protein